MVSLSSRPTGHDAWLRRDQLDDRRAAARIARRGDDAGRLVEQQVRETLLADRAAVDLDRVGGADEGVQLAGPAVHAHAAGLDQLVGASPGGDSGAREVRVQPHATNP